MLALVEQLNKLASELVKLKINSVTFTPLTFRASCNTKLIIKNDLKIIFQSLYLLNHQLQIYHAISFQHLMNTPE